MDENISLFEGDCLEKLDKVKNKSINLICIDPPYNIGKDTWDNIDNYNNWLLKIISYFYTNFLKLYKDLIKKEQCMYIYSHKKKKTHIKKKKMKIKKI